MLASARAKLGTTRAIVTFAVVYLASQAIIGRSSSPCRPRAVRVVVVAAGGATLLHLPIERIAASGAA